MTSRVKNRCGDRLSRSVAACCVMAVAVGALAQTAAPAPAVNTVPDAQVESNVLRALASAPEFSTQNIQTTTVYGVVTLTGNVHDDGMRTKAENLVARVQGVKKVVDQMTLGDTAPSTSASEEPNPAVGNVPQSQAGQVLLSDGTYGPAPSDQSVQPAEGGGSAGGNAPSGDMGAGGNGSVAAGDGAGASPAPGPEPGRRPMYGNAYGNTNQPAMVPGGQRAGIPVMIPAGALLRIRVNRGLTSNQTQIGTPFDGTVLTDVIADGAVAVPRGATVQGIVVDAKKAGVFKGQGILALQINSLTLGGRAYPLTTQVWQQDGPDKALGTANTTAGGAVVGALFGALVGGGEGAAVGAGIGAGAGLAGSAASPRGQVVVPPESVLTFRTAQPTAVQTVSEAEMQRLSYAAGPGPQQRPPMRRYYSPYYGYYYAPAY